MKHRLLYIVLLFMLPMVGYAQDSPIQVIATTTIIADVAANVGGDFVEITALVPPDADTHAFNPDPQDVAQVSAAQVVLVNGANLEETLLEVIENAATVELTVVSHGVEMLAVGASHADEDHEDGAKADEHAHEAAEFIGQLGVDADCGADEAHDDEHGDHDDEDHDDEHADEHADDEHADEDHDDEHGDEAHAEHAHEHGSCDPHVWGNPQNVMHWADNIAAAFAAVDPDNAATYASNAATYKDQLAALDAELEVLFGTIPEAERKLVTNHEFLSYLAARYDFEVVGAVIPGGSTLAEPAPQEIAALMETIEAEGVPAIFAEVSDVGALTTMIASDLGDVAVVTLYSESLSAAGGPAATYLDYMRYNANAIATALGG